VNPLGNPINIIPAPTELQILGALPRKGMEALAAQILRDTLEQTGFYSKLRQLTVDSVSAGVVAGRELFEPIVEDFKRTYLEKTVRRRENMYLTNENLLLMQNPDGTEAFALLHNLGKGGVAAAAVRLPFDAWETITSEYAKRSNITPIQKVAYTEVVDRAKAEVAKREHDLTMDELKKKRETAEESLKADPEYEITLPSADLLMRNGLELVQVNDILAYGPPMMLKFGLLTVDGDDFFVDWYIPGFQGQIETMRYSNPNTGESVTLELPLDSTLEFNETTINRVDRNFLPGERVRRKDGDGREYIILAPNHNKQFYIVREFKDGVMKRLLVLPGDDLTKAEMRPEDLLGYVTPDIAIVLQGKSVDNVFDELEEAYTKFGMFKGKIATHVEFGKGGIRMKIEAAGKMRYLILTDKAKRKAEPIKAVRDLTTAEANAYLGVRSQVGDRIQEIIHVDGNYGLATESTFRDGRWEVKKYFLMPLGEMEKRAGDDYTSTEDTTDDDGGGLHASSI